MRNIAIAIIGAALLGAACAASLPASAPHALLDQPFEAISAPTVAGEMVRVPEPGHVTVVDFWATDCAPCVQLLPGYDALAREKQADGVRVFGVAADDNPGRVINFAAAHGIGYPLILDGQSGLFQGRMRVSVLPQSFVFDRAGRLRYFAPATETDPVGGVRRAVDALLREGN